MSLQRLYKLAQDSLPAYPIHPFVGDFVCAWIKQNQITTMLEIGSGLGYSANYFALHSPIQTIISYEKQLGFYLAAKKYQLSNKITFHHKDFLTTQPSLVLYDLVFLDAAKSQQKSFFDKIIQFFLKPKGCVIIDNLFLKRVKKNKIHQKHDAFVSYLITLRTVRSCFITSFDGLMLICRKN